MGSIGGAEILLVLVVALIVLGPTRLPDAARSLGKALGEFRRMSAGFQAEVRDAFSETPATGEPPSRLPAGGPDGSAAAAKAGEAGTGTGRDRPAE